MKRLALICFCALSASFVFAQEAGYTIHVDFHTKEVSRAVIVPVGTLKAIPVVGDLDVSALVNLETNIGLGIGVGKGWPLGENLKFNAGVSFLDAGGEWNPHLGAYAGFSWRF